ncbi:MAG: hypothetical protein QW559_03400 [Candidatus Woesearchaeota archaeon]
MKKVVFVLLVLLSVIFLVIAGCKPKVPTAPLPAAQPPTLEPTPEGAQELEQDINAIASVEQEISPTELEKLEQDIASIEQFETG